MPTSLRKLLCDLYTWRQEYEARAYRYAAAVAARKQADSFTVEQIEALSGFANGEMPIEVVFSDELHWCHVRGWDDEGERLAKDDDAKKLGIPAFAHRMWDVAVPLVVDAVQRALPGHYVSQNVQDRYLAGYCSGALANNLDSDDWFAHAVELLDRDGFTNTLLRELWRECSNEAEYRELPKPRDAMPPMTEGQGKEGAEVDAWLTYGDISERSGFDRELLRKRLERYRAKHHDCYREVAESDRKPRESRYLYRLSSVQPLIAQLKRASGETSGERPAKKT